MDRRRRVGIYFWYGLGLWGAGTLLLRLAGQHLFDPDSPPRLAVAFALAVPVVIAATYPVFRRRVLPRDRWLAASVAIILANAGLDALAMIFFDEVFPNLEPGALGWVGAWLLWAYALFLDVGFAGLRTATRARRAEASPGAVVAFF